MGEMIGTHKWGDFVIRTAAAVVGFGTLSMGQRTAARADMGLVRASPSRMRRMGRRPALLTRMGRSVVRNGYEPASRLPLVRSTKPRKKAHRNPRKAPQKPQPRKKTLLG